MNIPPKYEDVVAELEAALKREAALREELEGSPDVSIKNCIFEGENRDGSQAFEFEISEGRLNKLTKINLDGWLCYGPSGGNPIDALQKRLTAADQRADDMVYALARIQGRAEMFIGDGMHMPTTSIEAIRDIAAKAALKPAAEGEGS